MYSFSGTYCALLRAPEHPVARLCALAHGAEQVSVAQPGQVYFASCAAHIAQVGWREDEDDEDASG